MTNKKLLLSLGAISAVLLNGTPIPVFSTGQTLEGLADPHWSVTSGAPGDAYVTVNDGMPFVNVEAPEIHWLANDAASSWIQPTSGTADAHAELVNYTFTTTFDLTGFKFATTALQFRALGDNQITAARLNGHDLGFTWDNYLVFSPLFIVNNPAFFVEGVNTLEFDVYNALGMHPVNPVGFRLEISGDAEVPEPQSALLIGAGLAGLGALRSKRRSQK